MAGTETKRVLTIATLERLNVSASGNPRFKVTFTTGESAQTKPDAAINHGIENSEFRDVPVEFTFNAEGRITLAKPVEG